MGINIDQVQHKVNSFNADRKARQDDFNKVRMDFSDKLKQFDADISVCGYVKEFDGGVAVSDIIFIFFNSSKT